MYTGDGKYIEVDLFDISLDGVGFDVAIRDVRKISVGNEIQFRCTWNSQLFSQGRYIVRSINGQKVGAQRIQR